MGWGRAWHGMAWHGVARLFVCLFVCSLLTRTPELPTTRRPGGPGWVGLIDIYTLLSIYIIFISYLCYEIVQHVCIYIYPDMVKSLNE